MPNLFIRKNAFHTKYFVIGYICSARIDRYIIIEILIPRD